MAEIEGKIISRALLALRGATRMGYGSRNVELDESARAVAMAVQVEFDIFRREFDQVRQAIECLSKAPPLPTVEDGIQT